MNVSVVVRVRIRTYIDSDDNVGEKSLVSS